MMHVKAILTKHSPEFGSRLMFKILVLFLLLEVLTLSGMLFEALGQQWGMFAGGALIVILIIPCFIIVYLRKDNLLIVALSIMAIVIVLYIIAVINESYYIYKQFDFLSALCFSLPYTIFLIYRITDDVDNTTWDYIDSVYIDLVHVVLAIIASISEFFLLSLFKGTRD